MTWVYLCIKLPCKHNSDMFKMGLGWSLGGLHTVFQHSHLFIFFVDAGFSKEVSVSDTSTSGFTSAVTRHIFKTLTSTPFHSIPPKRKQQCRPFNLSTLVQTNNEFLQQAQMIIGQNSHASKVLHNAPVTNNITND